MLSIDESYPEDEIKSLWIHPGASKYMQENFNTVLLHHSESKDPKIAIVEWSFYANTTDGEGRTCICSHVIHDMFYIINSVNGNILRVGNDCINKLYKSSDLDLDIKEFIKRKRYTGDRLWCRGCHRHNIMPEKNWVSVCTPCWKAGIEPEFSSADKYFYRQCKSCKDYCLPLDSPDYKTMCTPCYKEAQEEKDKIIEAKNNAFYTEMKNIQRHKLNNRAEQLFKLAKSN